MNVHPAAYRWADQEVLLRITRAGDGAMLVDRAPEIMQHAVDPDEDLSRCQVSPGLGRRLWSRRAKSAPNFRHQCRMLSWVTTTPRSARISSTSRKLRLNT